MSKKLLITFAAIASILIIIISGTLAEPNQETTPRRIILDEAMVISDTAVDSAVRMVDEQKTTKFTLKSYPDPLSDLRANVPFESKYTPWTLSEAIIDLGAVYRITDILLYDCEGGANPYTVYGTLRQWDDYAELFVEPCESFMQWKQHSMDLPVRYLKFQSAGGSSIAEIAVYGYKEPGQAQAESGALAPISGNTAGTIIGQNALMNSAPEDINIGGFVREYHEWAWDYQGDNASALRFETSAIGVNFDVFYQTLSGYGMDILWCLQGSAAPTDYLGKPLDKGGSGTNPLNYSEHSSRMFQFAARYGSNITVDRSLLKYASSEQPKIGLGYIKYYEGGNEPDSTWGANAPNQTFTPQELAAMMSADYDGHEGRMGSGYGVKAADPQAFYIMPGLSAINFDYINQVDKWFKENRKDQQFAADAINFHLYASASGKAVSPEEAGFRKLLEQVAAFRNERLPGKQIWITEFGWDTNPESPMAAKAHSGYTTEQVQGHWIVRAYLAAFAAGVDRAAMYMLADVDKDSKAQYASSGLLTYTSDGAVKKPSYYYISAMENALGDMVYAGETESSQAEILNFKNPKKPGETAIAVWSPTSDGTKLPSFKVKVGAAQYAKVVELANGELLGKTKELAVTGGEVSVDVSESPVFILAYDAVPESASSPAGISAHPMNFNAQLGGAATFTVAASGSEPKQYQWQRQVDGEWVDIEYGTSNSLKISPVAASDRSAEFRVLVWNNDQETNSKEKAIASNAASINLIAEKAAFVSQPSSQEVLAGEEATFSALAEGSTPIYYKWQKAASPSGPWSDIAGASGSSYKLKADASDNGSYYRAAAQNGAMFIATTSEPAKLTVTKTLVPITSAKISGENGYVGGSATIVATDISGSKTRQYSWQVFDGQWKDVSGASSSALELPKLAIEQNGQRFRVLLWNGVSPTKDKDSAFISGEFVLGVKEKPASERILLSEGMIFEASHPNGMVKIANEQAMTLNEEAYLDPLENQFEYIEFADGWKLNGGEGIIDLGEEYVITDILAYDTYGVGDATFYAGDPADGMKLLFTEPLDAFYQWKAHKVDARSRYLKISSASSEAEIAEIALYGFKASLLWEEEREKGNPASSLIKLDKSMIETEGAKESAEILFDQQPSAGNPAYGDGGSLAGSPQTLPWQPSGIENAAVINLGGAYHISAVGIYSKGGQKQPSASEIRYGSAEGGWIASNYMQFGEMGGWSVFPADFETKHLQFAMFSPIAASVCEIVLYGYPLEEWTEIAAVSSQPTPAATAVPEKDASASKPLAAAASPSPAAQTLKPKEDEKTALTATPSAKPSASPTPKAASVQTQTAGAVKASEAKIIVYGEDDSTIIRANGGTLQMFAKISEGAGFNEVVWTLAPGSELYASISKTGLLSAKENGMATVVASAADGSGVKGIKSVVISGQGEKAVSITVSSAKEAASITKVAGKLQMYAATLPSTTAQKLVAWSLKPGDEKYASISQTGELTAKADGVVTVVASAIDGSGVSGSKVIIISGQSTSVKKIVIKGPTEIKINKGYIQLTANVTPINATNDEVFWYLEGNGTNYASISTTGKLTAKANGKVTVIAASVDGSGVTGRLEVTITKQSD
ncbi:MAG: Ig-like domain-containing protein [Clostridiales bacterium]|jgi:hypothetical protein|nr:Ig-like domain-containing protein [Clostridiales bacterium]